MPSQSPVPDSLPTDLAQAFQEIAKFRHRGERAASAMESQLESLEKKIDDLLAAAEAGNIQNGDGDGEVVGGGEKGDSSEGNGGKG
ncbi:MAG: hypothetical protein Q9220_006123 [cf. Caloplaca sp. 1 TL-2023]